MRVCLFPDLSIERWKSMNLYADRVATWLPRVANGGQIRSASVTPSRWIDRYFRLPYLNRVLNDRFYSRYVIYPWAARRCQADINHVLDHSYGHLLQVLDPQRTVVTVHDLYPLHVINRGGRTPRQRARRRLLRWVMAQALRACWLIVPSRFIQQELLRLTHYPADRISVVPLGVDEVFFRPVDSLVQRRCREAWDVPENAMLLLHVGSCEERKNIELLLQALHILLSGVKVTMYLMQIGGQFNQAQRSLIHRLGIEPYIRQLRDLSTDELVWAYHTADLVLLPSTYEGFGLTALEAMASGTPVVASDIGALRELIGEAGRLVAPTDPQQLARAVIDVLSNTSLRDQLVEKGRIRAAAFSWAETARQTWAVYERVYAERA